MRCGWELSRRKESEAMAASLPSISSDGSRLDPDHCPIEVSLD